MFLPVPRELLSQGDIFTELDLIDSAAPTSPPQKRNVIVLSNDCEIDKPSNRIVLVCAIRSVSDINPRTINDIRKNGVYNTMYIGSISNLPESFIDFRFIFRVDGLFLEEGIRRGLRIASVDDEARLALGTFFYRFLTRAVSSTRTPLWLTFLTRVFTRINPFRKKS